MPRRFPLLTVENANLTEVLLLVRDKSVVNRVILIDVVIRYVLEDDGQHVVPVRLNNGALRRVGDLADVTSLRHVDRRERAKILFKCSDLFVAHAWSEVKEYCVNEHNKMCYVLSSIVRQST